MLECKRCGSGAVNPEKYGRDKTSNLNLRNVCYWRARAEKTLARPGVPRLVILESPYTGEVERNLRYARAAVRDSLARGEAPLAFHLLYTQPGILRDDVLDERNWGINAGLSWGLFAHATVVYADFGISPGMAVGIKRARIEGRCVEVRRLDVSASEVNDA